MSRFSDTSSFWISASALWTAGVLALALGPQSGQQWLMQTFGDKALHGAAFTIGCYSWGRGLEVLPSLGKSRPLIAGIIALLVGVLIEYLQSFVPTRQSDIYDVLADLGGIVPAIVLLMLSAHRVPKP